MNRQPVPRLPDPGRNPAARTTRRRTATTERDRARATAATLEAEFARAEHVIRTAYNQLSEAGSVEPDQHQIDQGYVELVDAESSRVAEEAYSMLEDYLYPSSDGRP